MKFRVLIIEDEPAIADTILYALETEGFHCSWCATGEAGLRALDGKPESAADSAAPPEPAAFDLAVLDVGLPDISGFDLCREIRKRHALPILFLTARAGEIDRVVGLEIGADDYVVKPFSPRELAARVKAILRRTASGAAEANAIDANAAGAATADFPFRLDQERRLIAYFGTALELSRYEYRLLAVFLEKPGRVWSREQLMEKAWDSPDSSLDRTVDAHIKSLRAKLKEIRPEIDPVRTHRGMGYSLKEDW
jgi:two-component system, OmpR family, catabolic regulation response regulator CreB